MRNSYQAEFADENFEIFYANSNEEAIEEALKYEEEHGDLFNVFLLDENDEPIETIL